MTAPRAQEPLPCPFCGGKPTLDNSDITRREWYFCEDCGVKTASFIPTFDEAREAWNRRAPSADTRRLAYLEAALRKVAKKEGRYSRDPLDFACNTVEAMADVATSALAGTWENEEADAAMTQEGK